MVIRPSGAADFGAVLAIINQAARVYQGVIPDDRWHEPYMAAEELRHEIDQGVVFWVAEEEGRIAGVMGIQDKGDVALVRHAYVSPAAQRSGVGTRLLRHVEGLTDKPILIGTWAAATWAIEFYRRNGFTVVSRGDKDRLLKTYWSIPARQVETSVVLADRRGMETLSKERHGGFGRDRLCRGRNGSRSGVAGLVLPSDRDVPPSGASSGHWWAALLCLWVGFWIASVVWARQPGLQVPPVVGYLAAGCFLAAGVSLLLQGAGFTRAAIVPAILTAAALAGIGGWIGFGPGSRRCGGNFAGVAFVPAEWTCRLVFGAGAVLTGGIVLLMLRSLFKATAKELR